MLLDIWSSIWRKSTPTLGDRLYMPLRFLAAFDAIDAELAADGNA